MIEAYKKFWSNYANFSDRSTRADYWYAVLANMLVIFVIGFVCGFIDGLTGNDSLNALGLIITGIYSLAIIVPSLAITVRRLHDINKSGWYYFMSFIPLVGGIIVLVYLCTASVTENNSYGKQV